MAQMIPSSLSGIAQTTAGERKLFEIFRKALPDHCIVRYEMLLGERDYRPDYMILDPARGVLLVEVKDWGVDSIVTAAQEQFQVKGYQGSSVAKPQMNPDLKCQIYLSYAKEQMRAMPGLRENIRLKVHIDYAVAFPNITRSQFIDESFADVLPHNVLLKEDLASDGKAFWNRYQEILPLLQSPLTDQEQRDIVAALLPDLKVPVRIGVEKEGGKVRADQLTDNWYTISLEQEQVAKSLGEGHRLLRGIAGTGKTLIMLYRAKLLLANNPSAKILVLCWNISLATYMKQLYDALSIDVPHESEGKVQIQHFADFVKSLMRGATFSFDSPRFTYQLNSVPISLEDQFDTVMVDEAQDFRREWIEFIYDRIVKGKSGERSLIISADDAQRIYSERDFRWADLRLKGEISARGRSRVLKTIYRNSARVWTFAAFLQPERAAYLNESEDRLKFFSKGGYDPQLIECSSLQDQVTRTVEIVRMFKEKGFTNRNFLILYRSRFQGFPIVERLLRCLEQEGIPSDWIAEDREAKNNFEWEADTVKVSTVHSAKGMDCPIVIVLGAETFAGSDDTYDDEVRLLYVA